MIQEFVFLPTPMNLILLFDDDFLTPSSVRLTGRRALHVASVHRSRPGESLIVGLANGKLGEGQVQYVDADRVDLKVRFTRDPPPALPCTLVLALPRPKVLNRVVASAVAFGVKRIFLINAWRVEKSYWGSARLSESNLRLQSALGLEQAGDTVMPQIETRRLFRAFVEQELPSIAAGTLALVAHPGASASAPREVTGPMTLAIGPEGGFITAEVESLIAAGFLPVTLGPRVLRVETAVAALLGRMS